MSGLGGYVLRKPHRVLLGYRTCLPRQTGLFNSSKLFMGSGFFPLNAAPHLTRVEVRLCNPGDCSTPGFSVLHHLPEFPQTHVHCVDDTTQQSHPLSPPPPPAFNLPQHYDLFQ